MHRARGSVEAAFAQVVRQEFARTLETAVSTNLRRLRIRSVRPDAEAERPTVVVLLDDASRPGRLVGTRCSTAVVSENPEDDERVLALAAAVCATNFEESVEAAGVEKRGSNCPPGVIWI